VEQKGQKLGLARVETQALSSNQSMSREFGTVVWVVVCQVVEAEVGLVWEQSFVVGRGEVREIFDM